MDLCGGPGCGGSLDPPGVNLLAPPNGGVGNIALARCGLVMAAAMAAVGGGVDSAVSRVVGKSISLWIWIPSPGPMCEMWLKLEGAEINLERRSWFLQKIR